MVKQGGNRPPVWRSKKGRWLVAVFLVVAVPIFVNAWTPVPAAHLLRFLIGLHKGIHPPPNYAVAEQAVQVMAGVPVTSTDAPLAHLDIYQPKARSAPRPIILWIHGGGYVGHTAADARVYLTVFAHEGYVVAGLDFTRPPEARYPVPVRQANAALRYLAEHATQYGGDATRVFVAGNSSGAQIASQLAAVETDPSLAAAMHLTPALTSGSLRGAVLNSGVYDLTTLEHIHFSFLHTFLWAYTGYRDVLKSPDINQMSATAHITSHYPPVFVTAGDADPMEPQVFELEAALLKQGVPVTAKLWNGSGAHLPHDYQFEFDRLQTRELFAETLQFLRSTKP